MYEAITNNTKIKLSKVYYNKYEDNFSIIVPDSKANHFKDMFLLRYIDIFTDKEGIEVCNILDKSPFNGRCKIYFDVKSRGYISLQDAIIKKERLDF